MGLIFSKNNLDHDENYTEVSDIDSFNNINKKNNIDSNIHQINSDNNSNEDDDINKTDSIDENASDKSDNMNKTDENISSKIYVDDIDENDSNSNKIDSVILENSLDQTNIRNNSISASLINYAPDINQFDNVKELNNNISRFTVQTLNKGFTSCVYVMNYNNAKIIKKKYICRDKTQAYYVNDAFINESFNNEINGLEMLKDELHFPKIIKIDREENVIYMTYVGELLGEDKKDINLSIIPKDWKHQMYSILETLKKHNLYHNDITERNLCLLNKKLYLIDFGNCKTHIDTYYRNFYKELLLDSHDIIDFLDKVNKNAMEMRKCCHGFN